MDVTSLPTLILFRVSLLLILSPRHATSSNSYVVDSHIQKNVTDYCAKTEHCPEGTHVMCMYKHSFNFHGRCGNMRELSIDATHFPDLAEWLVNVSNAIRRKIALGKETANGKPLPRGYGMFKLSWDPELGMFAQTLADECLIQHDLCRASKRFSNPGQVVGVCRFTFPNWAPLTGVDLGTSKKLTPTKLKYAIKQIMMSWYNQKKYVTDEMIQRYPEEGVTTSFPTGRPYLDIISGKSTHMGCGISGYSQFAHYDNNASKVYNHVQLVCNYSHRPANGTPLYTTEPPTQVGYTIKCGCPDGYDEDPDCLCVENGQTPTVPPNPPPKICSDNKCTPAVVLLPIFNVEDAPPEKLIPPRFFNQSRRIGQSFDLFDDRVINGEPEIINEFNDLLGKSEVANIRLPYKARNAAIQRRTYDAPKQAQLKVENSYSKTIFPVKERTEKQSIFSKAAKFHLPKSSNQARPKEIIKDVAPRKDFANVQKLLQVYLNKKRNNIGNIFNRNENILTPNAKPTFNEIFNYKTDIDNSDKVVNNNIDKGKQNKLNFTRNIKIPKIKHPKDEADKKFLALLDNLEQEVKHTEFDAADKEIFDARIRKLYSTILGKQLERIEVDPYKSLNKKVLDNLINYENAADTEFLDEKILNERIYDKPKTYDGIEERNQDIIRKENKNHRNVIKTLYNGEDYFNDNPNYRNEKSLQNVWEDKNIIGNYKHKVIRSNNDFNPQFDINEDPLSYERKKYYQEKLDNLERNLQGIKTSRHHNVHPTRQIRPVLPTYQSQIELRPRKSSTQMDTFYVPDRARFIHGF